jgi:hypothetical protein
MDSFAQIGSYGGGKGFDVSVALAKAILVTYARLIGSNAVKMYSMA